MSEPRWFNSLYLTLTRDEIEPIMRGHVTFSEFRVLVALFDYANRKTGECFPSHQTLAEKTNLSVGGVRKAIAKLEERGVVNSRGRVADDGRQISNLYTVDFGASPQEQVSATPVVGACPPSGDEPITIEPITKELSLVKEPEEPEGFAEFWSRWPRKKAKGQARAAWRAATKKAPAAAIMRGLEVQWASLARKAKPDPKSGQIYCPYPATWLNGERWADEVQGEQPKRYRFTT